MWFRRSRRSCLTLRSCSSNANGRERIAARQVTHLQEQIGLVSDEVGHLLQKQSPKQNRNLSSHISVGAFHPWAPLCRPRSWLRKRGVTETPLHLLIRSQRRFAYNAKLESAGLRNSKTLMDIQNNDPAAEHHYARWEKNGRFYTEINRDPNAPVFTIVIPPPNVTGSLHMGHALQHTLMDVLTRLKECQYRTSGCREWTSAGISTVTVSRP